MKEKSSDENKTRLCLKEARSCLRRDNKLELSGEIDFLKIHDLMLSKCIKKKVQC